MMYLSLYERFVAVPIFMFMLSVLIFSASLNDGFSEEAAGSGGRQLQTNSHQKPAVKFFAVSLGRRAKENNLRAALFYLICNHNSLQQKKLSWGARTLTGTSNSTSNSHMRLSSHRTHSLLRTWSTLSHSIIISVQFFWSASIASQPPVVFTAVECKFHPVNCRQRQL